jgi:copper chaperone
MELPVAYGGGVSYNKDVRRCKNFVTAGGTDKMKEQIRVAGMSCEHCVQSIEEALKQIGVAAKADLSKGMVDVDFDERTADLDKIKQTIEDQGFDVLS